MYSFHHTYTTTVIFRLGFLNYKNFFTLGTLNLQKSMQLCKRLKEIYLYLMLVEISSHEIHREEEDGESYIASMLIN